MLFVIIIRHLHVPLTGPRSIYVISLGTLGSCSGQRQMTSPIGNSIGLGQPVSRVSLKHGPDRTIGGQNLQKYGLSGLDNQSKF